MEIKTLVEIRGGRVRIQERDNETTVTIAHEISPNDEQVAKLEGAFTVAQEAVRFNRQKASELATALEESRALVGQRDKALDEVETRAGEHLSKIQELKRDLASEKDEVLALNRRLREQEFEHAKLLQAAESRAGGYDLDRHTEQKRAKEAEARLVSRNEMIEKIADQVTSDVVKEALTTVWERADSRAMAEAIREVRSILDGSE